MKRITAFITVLFLTFLTACFGNNSAWQEALTTPSEQKPIIKTVIDPSEIEGLEIPEEPIDYYDQFDWYKQNSEYFFPGFTLSKEWIDGKEYYQLLNEEKDVKVIVDKEGNAVVYHNGKSMECEMKALFAATADYTMIYVLDLTNDGKDELVIANGGGGTGVWEGTSDVYDLETFRRYEVYKDKILKELGTRITVEPLEIVKDNYLKCRVTDYKGNEYYGYILVSDDDVSKYSYIPEHFTGHYTIDVDLDRQCLVVSGAIPISPMYASYIGTLHSTLEFNPEAGSFELSDELIVELDQLGG